MMPSSGSSDDAGGGGSQRNDALRRWGPIVAIVAVIAIVAVLVVTSGGDDDDDTATGGSSTTAPAGDDDDTGTTAPGDDDGGGVDAAEGAISFSQAEEEGLDVTFPDSCDPETGRIAIPYLFSPECYANVDDNGGDTAPGVTADSIKIVVYVAPESDTILDYITAAISNDDTNADVEATIQGYVDLFNDLYQTYGRTVEVEFLHGSGQSTDEVAARADAVTAVEEMGAFAVLGSPALTNAWSQELAARGVPCIGCFGLPEPDPNIFTLLPSDGQNRLITVEYILKKLAGRPAEFAGDPALQGTERVFGHLYIETSDASTRQAEELAADLEEGGSGFAEQQPFTLDPNTLQEQATPIMARFRDAGVTSIVVETDPISLSTFTREATAQNYFPEWVMAPSTLIDTAAFGRTYDQEQWAHAFGLSPLAARTDPEAFRTLYDWYYGEEPPADDSEGVLSPGPLILFSALQYAGPNLTRESLVQGLEAIEPLRDGIIAVSFSYGDHGLFPGLDELDRAGIDNWTELWWDADEEGPDELGRTGPGMYRYVNGGQRYFVGDLDDSLDVFSEDGAITIFDSLPPAEDELTNDYPSPAGGG